MPTLINIWKVHHPQGAYNVACLDETMADLIVYPDADEGGRTDHFTLLAADDVTLRIGQILENG